MNKLQLSPLIVVALAGFLISAGTAAVQLAGGSSSSLLASSGTFTSGSIASTTSGTSYAIATITEPTGLAAISGPCDSGMLYVHWNPVPGALGYQLMRDGGVIYQGTSISYPDRGLSPGVSYDYSVQAYAPGMASTKATLSAHASASCSGTATATSGTGTSGGQTTTGGATSGQTITTGPVDTHTVPVTTSTIPAPTTASVSGTATVAPPPVISRSVVQTSATRVSGESIIRPLVMTEPKVSTEADAAHVAAFQSVTSAFVASRGETIQVRADLLKVINEAISAEYTTATPARKAELTLLRQKLASEIEMRVKDTRSLTPADVLALKTAVSYGLAHVQGASQGTGGASDKANKLVAAFAEKVKQASTTSDYSLMYRDSNHDGISDYDAKYVYNIDPKFASVPTTFNGRTYTPEQKILQGYDPYKKDLVRIFPDDPDHSTVPATDAYVLSSVALVDASNVKLTGEALPNSYVTLYISSTPTVVTVKTDASGKWEYTLSSELENGSHHIVVATVDTTGKILARSNRYAFTKTAQAATLEGVSSDQPTASPEKPSFIGTSSILILGGAFLAMLVFALLLMGLGARKYAHQGTSEVSVPETPPKPPASV